jgi:agmatine deiminase
MNEDLPIQQGYHMPPEWHPHSGTELHWPENRETWPGERLSRVEKVYLRIIEALQPYERIHLFVSNESSKVHVQKQLAKAGLSTDNIQFHIKKINDVWARDCGPLFIGRQGNDQDWEYAITNWEYNAWGGKYPPYGDDNEIPAYFSETYNLPRFDTDMVLEGGSIDINGEGVLLTTESVLLNPNRNPSLSKKDIEDRLKNFLGQKKIIWLKNGLAGDDTDGHIDDLSRFVNESTIVTMTTNNPDDVNYRILQENLEILHSATDVYGRSFTIETLPMPETRIAGVTVDGSEYVPASYANFYIANDVVLLPYYDQRYDDQVHELMQHYFPDRKVIGIPCQDLVWGQGAIHCITQQLYSI